MVCPTRATIKGPLRCLRLSLARQGRGLGARACARVHTSDLMAGAEHQIMKHFLARRDLMRSRRVVGCSEGSSSQLKGGCLGLIMALPTAMFRPVLDRPP